MSYQRTGHRTDSLKLQMKAAWIALDTDGFLRCKGQPSMSVIRMLQNRNFVGLILANTVLGSAFPIQLVLGGLVGLMLAPNPALATVPSSLQTFAGLLAAAPISLLMGRRGRRFGFALGALLTLVGALAAVQAVYIQSFGLLCTAHLLMGAGWAAFQYFRFAAGEVVSQNRRPIAISLMLSSLLIAAIAGPQVFMAAKDVLDPIPLAGAYAAIAVLAGLGLIPLGLVHMPPPPRPGADAGSSAFNLMRRALGRPAIRRAIGIAAVSQGVMVFLMVPTPIAMVGCGLSEGTAGDVIRWHIVAMFAPSFFTGFLIRKFGVQKIAVAGLLICILAAGIAFTGLTAQHFYGALIVLGIGWNFGFIGATTLLDAALSDEEKATVQGANDTIIAFVSTLCAFASGFTLSSVGWSGLAVMSAAIVLLALIAIGLRRPDTLST
jgi:predicted MFS family arabinose efflux permease